MRLSPLRFLNTPTATVVARCAPVAHCVRHMKMSTSKLFPEQCLRRAEAPLLPLEDDLADENIELSLGSLGVDGSYAPVTYSKNSSREKRQQLSSKLGDSSTKSAAEVVEGKELTLKDFLLKLDPSKASAIATSLAKRVEIDSESGLATTYNIIAPPRSGLVDSPASCSSDADTEIWSNLTSRLDSLAATFVGKEESLLDTPDLCATNSLCEADDVSEPLGDEIIQQTLKPEVFVAGDEEVELICSSTTRKEATDTSVSSSEIADSHSSISSIASSTYSTSSKGILRTPKYDPFGKRSDFEARLPQRRVHFEWGELKERRECSSNNGQLGVDAQTHGSDDSTATFEYVRMHFCGGISNDVLLDEL